MPDHDWILNRPGLFSLFCVNEGSSLNGKIRNVGFFRQGLGLQFHKDRGAYSSAILSGAWRQKRPSRKKYVMRWDNFVMRLRRWLGLLTALFAAAVAGSARATDQKPNIVFIMADDLGYADVGYRGSPVKTPNIDKLATEGVRMDDFYGEPVCTPSRAALMTGRYPMRYGLQTLVIFPSHTYGLPTDERTLPQALHDAGYATLMDGKWHLGHADRKYWPQNRGFDYFYGNVTGEVDYFTRDRGGIIDWQRNGVFVKETGYYMDLIGDDAVKLIDQQDGT